MSYTPTLLIDRQSYFKAYLKINKDSVDYPEDEAVQYIEKLHKSEYSLLSGIEIIVTQPELTKFNQLVRDDLNEYGIAFDVVND